MKKIIFGTIVTGLFVALCACGSSKKAVVTPPPAPAPSPSGMTEEVMPLSGPAYRSDADFFRAVQNGMSPERSMAQKIAMQNARQDLASLVQANVRAVIENYAKNEQTTVTSEYEAQYQELAYTVVDQQLRDVQVVDEKMYREESGSFRCYVCLQMSKDALEAALADAIAKDAKLNLMFDRMQFKQVYEEQMNALK